VGTAAHTKTGNMGIESAPNVRVGGMGEIGSHGLARSPKNEETTGERGGRPSKHKIKGSQIAVVSLTIPYLWNPRTKQSRGLLKKKRRTVMTSGK